MIVNCKTLVGSLLAQWWPNTFQCKVVPPPPPPAVTAEWPAHYAPTFFGHGYPSEDADRTAAIVAAKPTGCIKVLCPDAPSDELAMHLLHLASPVDGHYLNPAENWYSRASVQGVSRYVLDIGNGAQLARWRFLVKDYPANTVQFIVNGKVMP